MTGTLFSRRLLSRWPHYVERTRAFCQDNPLRPLHERLLFGRSILLFDGVDRAQLGSIGEVRTPSIADLFVAVMGQDAEGKGVSA